jgi:FixJ family two-component response regulator
MQGLRVYVIEDDAVAAEYAARVVASSGATVVRFASAEEFLAEAVPGLRGCIVLDLHMAGMTGLELQAELLRREILLPVIIVSGQATLSSAVLAMKQQAFDFFEKPVDPQQLLSAVRRAIEFDQQQSIRQAEAGTVRGRYDTLSPRERQVMAFVCEGLANKQMAARLSLSEKTIEVHRGNVMRKMHVDSVAALVRAAMLCDGQPVSTGDSQPRA